jgi:acetylornithine deacetylase/succinyl-diaminopimelate desuccinylase-like protein
MKSHPSSRLLASTLLSAALLAPAASAAPKPATKPTADARADEAAFRSLYKELVEVESTLSAGKCTEAAAAMRARLLAAGFPATDAEMIDVPGHPNDGGLVAVYRGKNPGLKPLLLLAHVDVVEANRADWERDPFKLVEEDGFFYARGASDDKAMAAIFTDTFIRFRQQGYQPVRGLKLALTCGEETPDASNTVKWLVANRRDLVDAVFALNEGAGGELDASGKPVALQIQAGEKTYQNFQLEVTDGGGHSSRPKQSTAISVLAQGLVKLTAYRFPVTLNSTTRAYFAAQAATAPAEVAAAMREVVAHPDNLVAQDTIWNASPGWNSMLRTTCVATQLSGGHAPNALPQRARANVNCRIFPGVAIEDVRQQLVAAVGDTRIAVTAAGDLGFTTVPPVISDELLGTVRQVAAGIWPGVPVVPTMSTGATDGRFLNAAGIATYGLSGLFHDAEGPRAHGLNERIRVKSLLDGRVFLYETVRALSAK